MIKLKVIYPYLIIIFWLFILFNIFSSVLPLNINKSYLSKLYVTNFTPQGWGFFTRNPREVMTTFYKVDRETNVISEFTKTNNNSEYFFGLSRKNRLINMESAGLIKLTDTINYPWIKSNSNIFSFDLNNSKIDTLTNKLKPFTIKGDFLIVKQQRLPWAWSKSYSKIVMPYRYKRIYVKIN